MDISNSRHRTGCVVAAGVIMLIFGIVSTRRRSDDGREPPGHELLLHRRMLVAPRRRGRDDRVLVSDRHRVEPGGASSSLLAWALASPASLLVMLRLDDRRNPIRGRCEARLGPGMILGTVFAFIARSMMVGYKVRWRPERPQGLATRSSAFGKPGPGLGPAAPPPPPPPPDRTSSSGSSLSRRRNLMRRPARRLAPAFSGAKFDVLASQRAREREKHRPDPERARESSETTTISAIRSPASVGLRPTFTPAAASASIFPAPCPCRRRRWRRHDPSSCRPAR